MCRYGYYPTEMIGKSDEDFLAANDVAVVREDLDKARAQLAKKAVSQTRQLRYCRLLANGEKVR